MKREINCEQHGKSWAKTITNRASISNNERLMTKVGIALDDYICDGCGESLPTGSVVWAVSIWVENGANPYFPWEHDFIKELNQTEIDAIQRLEESKTRTEQGPG